MVFPAGMIRIHGSNLPSGSYLKIGSDTYPTGNLFDFNVSRIVAPGLYKIPVTLLDERGTEIGEETLESNLSGDYLFLAALADITFGDNNVSGNVETLEGDELFDGTLFSEGRVAFYLKGKIKGKYLLTAQLDTGEDELENLFSDLGRRDPEQRFRRIDPERFYPVYGDDSSVERDVDTEGRFYIRLDWDQSMFVWGNYSTGISGYRS